MAVSSLYPFTHSLSQFLLQPHHQYHYLSNDAHYYQFNNQTKILDFDGKQRRRGCWVSSFVVLSTHSNAKILKSNHKSRFGHPLSPYDTDDEDEDDWLLDDEFAEPVEFEVNGKRFDAQKRYNARQGSQKQLTARTAKNTKEKSIVGRLHIDRKSKLMIGKSTMNRYENLSEEIDLDDKWLPLLDYLSTFGLNESHFIQMYERHMPSLQTNVCSAEERLDYLLSVGVKYRDVRRILLRQPQFLEYTVENILKPHVAFLMNLGIPNSKIGQIIAAAPSLFSYSVENSLKPTIRYLVEEVGINEKNIGKVVQLSPQILVQRIDIL